MDAKDPSPESEKPTLSHERLNRLRGAVSRLGEDVLNILYPPRCLSCGKPDAAERPDHSRLCPGCEEQLEWVVPPFCSKCGESFSGNISASSFSCGNCAGRSYAFDFAIASYQANGLARDLVRRFKYQREFHLRVVLGALLGPALGDSRIASENDWIFVPVPLHPRRRREREFNQAAEISRLAAKRFGFEHVDALKRIRYTTQQARLDRNDRLANLRGAFELKRGRLDRLKGRNILLIDDVFTTGATVHECAAVLRKQAMPAKLAAVTVARG